MGDCKRCGQIHLSAREFYDRVTEMLAPRNVLVEIGAAPPGVRRRSRVLVTSPEQLVERMPTLLPAARVWVSLVHGHDAPCAGHYEAVVAASSRDPEVEACAARM
ncbi:MAG TPA: hypothetical protein VKD22_03760 [Ramlibacter sp.]|jgi:hypothetical protein|nr:hypothetical protein [Ramlibacter sp.]